MKLYISLTVLATLCLYVQLFAQPSGTNYVRQSDFGDTQNTSSPNASREWINLNFWNDVQTLSTQSDWFGPNYELDSSSHPHYVMLDDAPSDYGALAGQLIDLEYRLVEVNFDYLTYNERNTDLNTTDGKLHVLLCTSENDVRSFDPNNPSLFETSGTGQVLMTINFQGGPSNGLDLTAWNSTGSSASRRRYALSKSQTGTPGNPFTYVGLVWESEFQETRLVLDNFRITDICPDCEMQLTGLVASGCFDNTWVSPIRNNYYYYTVDIVDSASLAPIYTSIHQPATFSWDGVGNQGIWNGVQIADGQTVRASMRYYSCRRSQSNVVARTYFATRTAGCVDALFGGSKAQIKREKLEVWPNPVSLEGILNWRLNGQSEDLVSARIFDLEGKELYQYDLTESRMISNSYRSKLPQLSSGIYIFAVQTIDGNFYRKLQISK